MDIPVIPVSHTVLFPGAVVPLVIFEERMLALVDAVCRDPDLKLGVAFEPASDELEPQAPSAKIITLAQVMQHKRSPKGEITLLVQGMSRVRVASWNQVEPYPVATVSVLPEPGDDDQDVRARVQVKFFKYLTHCGGDVDGMREAVSKADTLSQLVDMVLASVQAEPEKRQPLLETTDPLARAEGMLDLLDNKLHEIDVMQRQRYKPFGAEPSLN